MGYSEGLGAKGVEAEQHPEGGMTGKAREEDSSETETQGPCQSESRASMGGLVYIREIPQPLHITGQGSAFPQGPLGGCLGP